MFGVGSIPWSPLARGALTRPISELKNTSRGQTDIWASNYVGAGSPGIVSRSVSCFLCLNMGTNERLRSVEELAKKKNLTMAQVATAWCLAKEGVTAPIVGTTKLENLKEIIGALVFS